MWEQVKKQGSDSATYLNPTMTFIEPSMYIKRCSGLFWTHTESELFSICWSTCHANSRPVAVPMYIFFWFYAFKCPERKYHHLNLKMKTMAQLHDFAMGEEEPVQKLYSGLSPSCHDLEHL